MADDVVDWVFAGIYSLIFIFLLHSYHHIEKSKLMKQKKIFHSLLMISVFLKVPYLILEAILIKSREPTLTEDIFLSVLSRLSGYFFLLTFCLLLILWARISDMMTEMGKNPSQRKSTDIFDNLWNLVHVTLFIGISFSIIVVGIIFRLLDQAPETQIAVLILDCLLNLGCGIGYLYYGARILFAMKGLQIPSHRKTPIIRKNGLVTLLCFIAFVGRSGLLAHELYLCITKACSHNHEMVILQVIFFSFGEVFPIICMFFITKGRMDGKSRHSSHNQRTKLLDSDNESEVTQSPASSRAFKMFENSPEAHNGN